MSRRLVLASASTARLAVLRDAGLAPEVVVSDVDEGGVEHLEPAAAALELARRKAAAVAGRVGGGALVVGCDSLLELDGSAYGKPSSEAEAALRWRQMGGRAGVLHTGHCVVDTSSGTEAAEVDSTVVRFGRPTDRELDAYIATGEPMRVAGAFTLEGYGAPWVDSIEGNHGTVKGISVPLLRGLLRRLGVELVDLWS